MQTQFFWKFFWSVTSKSFKKHLVERLFGSVALKSFKKLLFERFFQVLGSSSNFWTASADLGGPTAPHQSQWHRNHPKTFIWKVFQVCGTEIIQKTFIWKVFQVCGTEIIKKTFIWKVFPGFGVLQQLLNSSGRPERCDRPKSVSMTSKSSKNLYLKGFSGLWHWNQQKNIYLKGFSRF